MSFDEIIKLFTTILATVTAVAAMAWFLFGIIDAIHNWKHRKDLNRTLRKDLHISYINTFDALMKDIDKNKKVTNNDELIKLMSAVELAAGKIKNKGMKKMIFDKDIFVRELRDIESMDKDFNLNLKLPMSLFLEKINMSNIKLDKTSAPKLLILVATTIFTEHIDLLVYDEKYEDLVQYLKHFNKRFPKTAFLKYFK